MYKAVDTGKDGMTVGGKWEQTECWVWENKHLQVFQLESFGQQWSVLYTRSLQDSWKKKVALLCIT